MKLLHLVSACLVILLASGPCSAQSDDEDFPPGLRARYDDGTSQVDRVDSQIAFDWGTGSPDSRLVHAKPFRAVWNGQLLVRQAGNYRIHVHVQGAVSVEVDGQELLSEDSPDEPWWFSTEPFAMPFGERKLKVEYRRSGESGRVSVYWSADSFPLEPLPENLLFHDQPDTRVARLDKARDHVHRMRCFRCHSAGPDQSTLKPAPGPDLTFLRGTVSKQWLVEKILDPSASDQHARMPHFGLQAEEAEAVAAYLWRHTQQPDLKPLVVKEVEQDRQEGRKLFAGLGCLACHAAEGLGPEDVPAGGDLANVGAKRSADWIAAWLERPQDLNREHRMPVFALSDDERRQLAIYLSHLKTDADRQPPERALDESSERLQQGQRLIQQLACASCHQIPGISSPDKRTELPDDLTGVAGCLASRPDRTRNRPSFPRADRQLVVAAIEFERASVSTPASFESGRQLLRQKNCLACHERGHDRGLATIAGKIAQAVPELSGQSEALIPPSLQAVGDKLQDEALTAAIAGRQTRRLPWLQVRMPRFEHSESEAEDLLKYLVGHDRIPDEAPDSWSLSALARDEALVAGHALIGPRGLSCIACHKVGDFEPRQVALGTRGSDLQAIGKRMRPEYFLRWTRSPLRIVPGMEMPSYVKPVPGILDATIPTQLSAIWTALNDPGLTVPTNPSVVEQYWFVRSGQPARVVRDVMTCPDANGGGYTPRPLAVGFENGHTLVFDLDRFQIREWVFGDLARQRTQGKSWYWDSAGVPLLSGFEQPHDWALRPAGGNELVLPVEDQSMLGHLHDYRNSGLGIQLSYDLRFSIGGRSVVVNMKENLQPVRLNDRRTGIERTIQAEVPAGFELVLNSTIAKPVLGEARITLRAGDETRSLIGESSEPVSGSGPGSAEWRLLYAARVATSDLAPQPRPERPVAAGAVDTVPGIDGIRLPISQSIMPTAMCWTNSGLLAFTSLKGHVYLARDSNGDGIEDELTLFEEGLSAPYGIIADGDDLIVAHKPELIRLRDTDGDGRADERSVVATGWGHSDNYHDWTCGIVRDSKGRLYVGLGSDYAQSKRPRDRSRWRGAVLGIDPDGSVTPVGMSFRYPTGLAINADDQIFVTDNQGVQNTFNEINHLRPGTHYGVPSRYEQDTDAVASPPAIQVPHPWTRSVNGITFLPETFGAFAGHGVGCEYDSRFLVRFSLQKVGSVYQGATYYFSDPQAAASPTNFLGPLCAAISPRGELYIGSIHDSGWLGGQNTGEIVKLTAAGGRVNGVREIQATRDGFRIEFLKPVDPARAADSASYSISAYTRVWGGSYATPDSNRHRVNVKQVRVSQQRDSVELVLDDYRTGFVYEINAGQVDNTLWPATGHYTLHAIPD